MGAPAWLRRVCCPSCPPESSSSIGRRSRPAFPLRRLRFPFRSRSCLAALLLCFAAGAQAQSTPRLEISPTEIPGDSLDGATITLVPKNATFLAAGPGGGLPDALYAALFNPNDLDGETIDVPEPRLSAKGLALITLSNAPSGLTIASGKLLAREGPGHPHGGGEKGHRSAQLTLAYSGSAFAADHTVTVTVEKDTLNDVSLLRLGNRGGDDPGNLSADFTIKGSGDFAFWGAGPGINSLSVEEGGEAGYRVELLCEPPGDLTVRVSATPGGVAVDADPDADGDQDALRFTPDDWFELREVRVSAAEDADAATDPPVTLRHRASGTGCGSRPADLEVRVAEDDAAALELSHSSLLVGEGGRAAYSVALSHPPAGPVSVAVSGAGGFLTVAPDALRFTPRNWDVPQTVTVAAADNDENEHETRFATLRHDASSGSAEYNGLRADLRVEVVDDDTLSLALSAKRLRVPEGGTAQYTVAWRTWPAERKRVYVSEATGRLSVAPDALTFTSLNWDEPQTVTVTAGEDDDARSETVVLVHEGDGAGRILVTVVDDEEPETPEPTPDPSPGPDPDPNPTPPTTGGGGGTGGGGARPARPRRPPSPLTAGRRRRSRTCPPPRTRCARGSCGSSTTPTPTARPASPPPTTRALSARR